MIIHDPIYGAFPLDEPIRGLCLTPEVRRLSQIRLLNTLTPSLATLGEIRRYSHTLGVLYLASQNQLIGCSLERDAFSAAVLLHDIGTPPFGHLFEYHLKERNSWNHEDVIRQILTGVHARENRAHQFFAKQTIVFRSLLKQSAIDLELVEAIVSGNHRLSQLLFGTLDFDNLDNVARMNWALGQLPSADSILEIARNLSVKDSGSLLLSQTQHQAVANWLALRKSAYEVIVFDPPTVAAQAVLSEALELALESGALHAEDWDLTDESLLSLLMQNNQTKRMIAMHYLGRLPEQAFVLQISGSLKSLGFESRRSLTDELRASVVKTLGHGSLGYVFLDRGTFTKKLTLIDPDTGTKWSEGTLSESVILYAFSKAAQPSSHRRSIKAVQAVMELLNVPADSVVRCEVGVKQNRGYAQQTLNIET